MQMHSEKMNQEGKEPTLADVQDDAIKLLGFDPNELEYEFEEDRKASILNMMKAGLQSQMEKVQTPYQIQQKVFRLQGYTRCLDLRKSREDRR